MKTGHLLYLTGMNREAFNTLRRRGHLAFLDKHTGDRGDGDDSVDRFRPWHALGLLAFVTLQRLGVEPGRVAEAVDDSWPDIIRVAGLLPEPPRTHLCGTRVNDIGLLDTWGWPHSKSRGGKPMASIDVDLFQLWESLQRGLSEITDGGKLPAPEAAH